jgi:hypothetical protein
MYDRTVEIGPLHFEDYQQLLLAVKASYQGWQGGYWSSEAIQNLITRFPER